MALAPPVTPTRRTYPTGLIVVVLSLCGTVVSLQQTLVVPVLPEIPRLLDTTSDNASWLITATLLTAAVATPIMARMADMFGKKLIMMLCLAIVIAGSVVGAFSHTLTMAIVARGLQGMGAALIPVGISVMRDVLPKERVGSSVALMSATLGIGGAVGLPLSGIIYQHADWHTLFWVAAGLAVVMLVSVIIVLPTSQVRTTGRFDVIGAVLLSGALTCLLLAISKGGSWGLVWTLVLSAGAVVLLALWTPWELRTTAPMVDLRTSARRPVLLTNAASLLVGFAMFGNMLSTTQQLQLPVGTGHGFGLDVISAGLAMLPAGVMMILLAPVSAVITRQFGARVTLIAGSIVMAVGYLLRVVGTDQLWHVVAAAGVVSAGTAIAYAAMPTIIMRSVPITETASANGLNTLLRSIGTSASSATVAALLVATTQQFGAIRVPTVAAFQHTFAIAGLAALGGAVIAAFIPATIREPVSAPAARTTGATTGRTEIMARGMVLSGPGSPIRHAVVTVLTEGGDQVDWARVDNDGRYAVVVPEPGRYLVITSAEGWDPDSRLIDIGDVSDPTAIELGERLLVQGVVTIDCQGQDDVVVVITKQTGETMSSTRTIDDGRYAMPLPAHGRYVVSAVDPHSGARASQSVTLTGRTHKVDLVLNQ